MKNSFVIILALMAANIAFAQSYQFINSIYSEKEIYVENKFHQLLPFSDGYEISKKFFKKKWAPIWGYDIPNIEPFLSGISIEHFNDFSNKKNNMAIDGSKFTANIKVLDNYENHLKNNGRIYQLSKPFISCSKNWAILFKSSYTRFAAGGGELYIYRKVDGKWVYYHKINVILS